MVEKALLDAQFGCDQSLFLHERGGFCSEPVDLAGDLAAAFAKKRDLLGLGRAPGDKQRQLARVPRQWIRLLRTVLLGHQSRAAEGKGMKLCLDGGKFRLQAGSVKLDKRLSGHDHLALGHEDAGHDAAVRVTQGLGTALNLDPAGGDYGAFDPRECRPEAEPGDQQHQRGKA